MVCLGFLRKTKFVKLGNVLFLLLNISGVLIISSLRRELQETRTYAMKLKDQRKELEEKITLLQKESDKQSRIDKEQYSKLKREFKRTVDQINRHLEDKKAHYNQLLAAYNELNHVRNGSAGGSGKKRQEEVILI